MCVDFIWQYYLCSDEKVWEALLQYNIKCLLFTDEEDQDELNEENINVDGDEEEEEEDGDDSPVFGSALTPPDSPPFQV